MNLAELQIFADMPAGTRNLLLRVLVVIVALAVIFLARRLLTLVVLTPLKRVLGTSQARERVFGQVVGPVRMILIAIALLVTTQLLVPNDPFFRNMIGVVARVLILVAALTLIYRFVDLLLPTGAQLASLTGIVIEERLLPFLRVGIKLFVFAMGVVIVVQELGYDVSGLIAGIGIGGLAISLAAQDTIANLFGFASIVGDSPFAIGDYVKTPDVEGTIEHVGLRSTRVRKLDQTLITLPNSVMANSAISNLSRMRKRWVDFTIGIGQAASSAQMRELVDRLRQMLNEWPTVEPGSVQVFFSKFSPMSLDVLVRCFVQKQSWADLMLEQEAIQLRTLEIIAEMGLMLAMPNQPLIIENPEKVMRAPWSGFIRQGDQREADS
jgi:MscS family membrane protein